MSGLESIALAVAQLERTEPVSPDASTSNSSKVIKSVEAQSMPPHHHHHLHHQQQPQYHHHPHEMYQYPHFHPHAHPHAAAAAAAAHHHQLHHPHHPRLAPVFPRCAFGMPNSSRVVTQEYGGGGNGCWEGVSMPFSMEQHQHQNHLRPMIPMSSPVQMDSNNNTGINHNSASNGINSSPTNGSTLSRVDSNIKASPSPKVLNASLATGRPPSVSPTPINMIVRDPIISAQKSIDNFLTMACGKSVVEPSSASSEAPSTHEEIFTVKHYDVLCGRGGETNHHSGNIQYRHLVKLCQPAYISAKRRDKPKISESIVVAVRKLGGRFLKKSANKSVWHDVGNVKAREKTSQALREGAPELRNNDVPETDESYSGGEYLVQKVTNLAPSSPRKRRASAISEQSGVNSTTSDTSIVIHSSPVRSTAVTTPTNVTTEESTSPQTTVTNDSEDDSGPRGISLSPKGGSGPRGPRIKVLKRRLEGNL